MRERTPVEELEGRELDAAVAKEVMEMDVRQLVDDLGRPDGWVRLYHLGEDGQAHGVEVLDGERVIRRSVPPYSTDIAAAWEVVEHMRTEGAANARPEDAPMRYLFKLDEDAGFAACFVGPYDLYWSSEHDTAPEAICRAALRALRDR